MTSVAQMKVEARQRALHVFYDDSYFDALIEKGEQRAAKAAAQAAAGDPYALTSEEAEYNLFDRLADQIALAYDHFPPQTSWAGLQVALMLAERATGEETSAIELLVFLLEGEWSVHEERCEALAFPRRSNAAMREMMEGVRDPIIRECLRALHRCCSPEAHRHLDHLVNQLRSSGS